MQESVVRAEGVWKTYDGGTIPVLNGVDFHAHKSETVAICGPSGCGKSTLLYLLGGLDAPDRGSIRVGKRQLDGTPDPLEMLRHEVGFVFQLHNLIPDLSLKENCLIPAVAAGTPHKQAMERLAYLTERTGLSHRLDQRIQKLSGGERQRTAVCRALMNRPRILLADEPTGSLDERTSVQVFELLLDLAVREGVTLIMATHDRDLAERCNRTVVMKDGKIHEPASAK